MRFPLNTDALVGSLPHRKPMVWVDRVLDVSIDHGTTEVTLTHSLMLERDRAHVGALVEFLAQSYAYIRAVEAVQRQVRLRSAQLVAIDRFELVSHPLPLEGETLTAKLRTVRDLNPLYLVQGHVFDPYHRTLCTMEFKGHAQFAPHRNL